VVMLRLRYVFRAQNDHAVVPHLDFANGQIECVRRIARVVIHIEADVVAPSSRVVHGVASDAAARRSRCENEAPPPTASLTSIADGLGVRRRGNPGRRSHNVRFRPP